MTVKKKDMDGGRLFGLPKRPIITPEHNNNLISVKNLYKEYNKINPDTISVNNLNIKVKSFNNLKKTKKNNSFQPLLEELKLQLIEKIKLSLNGFIKNKFSYDNTIPFPELLDKLLDKLKEFEKLLNLLKLLDNQFNLNSYITNKQIIINKFLREYEYYIEQILRNNPNIETLKELYNQVQKYIREYSEFNKNNPIYRIIERLNNISDRILIKISILSSNINKSNLTNAIKRRINLLYDTNKNNKGMNYNSILRSLHDKYKNNPDKYNLKKLTELAEIGSKIQSISRISNMKYNKYNKNIMHKDLRETIERLNKSLNKYEEFKKYKNIIIPSQ